MLLRKGLSAVGHLATAGHSSTHRCSVAHQAASKRRQHTSLRPNASNHHFKQSTRQMACHSTQQQSGLPITQQQCDLPPELEGFRPNVGVCLFHLQTHMVFAATRVDDPGKSWQMPQGGIDPREAPRDAAIRELFEETCISSVEVVAELPRWLPYEFPTSVRCKLQGTWANYKGQAQRWFLLKFTGEDTEINLDTDHTEFDQWRWMPLEQLPDTVIEFKREVYREVVAEFKPVLERLKADNVAN